MHGLIETWYLHIGTRRISSLPSEMDCTVRIRIRPARHVSRRQRLRQRHAGPLNGRPILENSSHCRPDVAGSSRRRSKQHSKEPIAPFHFAKNANTLLTSVYFRQFSFLWIVLKSTNYTNISDISYKHYKSPLQGGGSICGRSFR